MHVRLNAPTLNILFYHILSSSLPHPLISLSLSRPILLYLLKSITAAHSNNVSVIEYSIKAIISNSLHSIIFGRTKNPISKLLAVAQIFWIRTIKFVCMCVCVCACNVFNGTFAIPKIDDRFFGRRFFHDGWRLNDSMCNSRKPFWESIIRFMYTCFFCRKDWYKHASWNYVPNFLLNYLVSNIIDIIRDNLVQSQIFIPLPPLFHSERALQLARSILPMQTAIQLL